MLDNALSGTRRPGQSVQDFVPESRFGFWFLGTRVWEGHVVQVSVDDLSALISQPQAGYPVILDAGCGQGQALQMLADRYRPQRLIGLDREAKALACAHRYLAIQGLQAELLLGDCSAIPLPTNCVDLLFCHQTFHHLVYQEKALAEFYRVLKPGGLFLFAESTRAYIGTWLIRFLFRHPMQSQRSADEYLAMIRGAGFMFGPRNVSLPYYWWSRTNLAGVLQLCRLRRVPPPSQREETLVYLVGVKPV